MSTIKKIKSNAKNGKNSNVVGVAISVLTAVATIVSVIFPDNEIAKNILANVGTITASAITISAGLIFLHGK